MTGRVMDQAAGDGWALFNGDSAEVLPGLPDHSVDFSVFSPPFSSTYTYSPSDRDLGNVPNDGVFWEQFSFITAELLRLMRPGRLVAVHVANLPAYENTHGYSGRRDFRGDTIRHFEQAGFFYHSEITIDKNPQAQAIRTHSKGLLFVQLARDAAAMWQAWADYLVVFRAPGKNDKPVTSELSQDEWIEYARPVWYGIRETDVLGTHEARESDDERHLCLASGSLVLTRDGYVPIESVSVGDKVLTHKGRWRRVLAKTCSGVRPVVRVCAQGVADLRVTPDHPVLIRRGSGSQAKRQALSATPEWAEAGGTLGSYVNLPLPPVKDNPISENDWWIIGRWLGDGHRSGHGSRSFIISCSYEELPGLIDRLGDRAGHIFRNRTACQVAIRDEEGGWLKAVLKGCGSGAANKKVPAIGLALCPEKADALLSGYLSADGHYVEHYDRWMASSVSRALLLGMAMVAQRARGVVASVYAGRSPRKHVIEGRVVEAKQDWIFSFRNSDGRRKSGWIDDDGAWKKVRQIRETDSAEVWDLQVEEDESLVAEGCVVHNCPLQLPVIERAVRLWSARGETVLSPFAGIGSEGVGALRHGRRFVGVELKPSYFRVATRNLRAAENGSNQDSLFGEAS